MQPEFTLDGFLASIDLDRSIKPSTIKRYKSHAKRVFKGRDLTKYFYGTYIWDNVRKSDDLEWQKKTLNILKRLVEYRGTCEGQDSVYHKVDHSHALARIKAAQEALVEEMKEHQEGEGREMDEKTSQLAAGNEEKLSALIKSLAIQSEAHTDPDTLIRAHEQLALVLMLSSYGRRTSDLRLLSFVDHPDHNYAHIAGDEPHLLFRHYKTAAKYGEQKVAIGETLGNALKGILVRHPVSFVENLAAHLCLCPQETSV